MAGMLGGVRGDLIWTGSEKDFGCNRGIGKEGGRMGMRKVSGDDGGSAPCLEKLGCFGSDCVSRGDCHDGIDLETGITGLRDMQGRD